MKAIVSTKYGSPDVLRFEEVPKPAPADDEVLIKLYAASVNPLDFHLLRGHVRFMTGLFRPKHKILGADIAGRVEAAGRLVKHLKTGDEVFGGKTVGGFAEYVCVAEGKLALKPANVSFEAAAAAPVAGLTALQGLRDKGRIRPGQKVLIDGASGGVGTFAVQIAKSFGTEVTAVCSTGKMDTALSIGADQVIDYTREDFTRSGQRYDLIFGANAYHSLFDYMRALKPDGIYVKAGGRANLGGMAQDMLVGPLLPLIGRNRMPFFIAKMITKDLDFLRSLIEAGKVVPVIDRRYPLGEVAEAIRYLEKGHATGKIVITIDDANNA
jgi:NADPH:quinone reductase-like Zn-dependent oxidoreductase